MPNAAGIAELRRENALLAERLEALKADCAALRVQLEWFKRQLFGRRSEKRIEVDLTEQADLFEALGVDDAPAVPEDPPETVSYRRRPKARGAAVNEAGLRFDDTVPVTTIEVRDPAVESIPASERVVVGEKVVPARLRPGRGQPRGRRAPNASVTPPELGKSTLALAGNPLRPVRSPVSAQAQVVGGGRPAAACDRQQAGSHLLRVACAPPAGSV